MVLLAGVVLLFSILYLILGRFSYLEYRDTLFSRSAEGENTVYTAKVDGEAAVLTVEPSGHALVSQAMFPFSFFVMSILFYVLGLRVWPI